MNKKASAAPRVVTNTQLIAVIAGLVRCHSEAQIEHARLLNNDSPLCLALKAIENPDAMKNSAAELLAKAYAAGADSGSVRWEDLDLAHEVALEELGKERAEAIRLAVQPS